MSERRQTPYSTEIPRPTGAPMVAAAGVTLIFAGLVTNWAVTIVGSVMALGAAVVWFRHVFPLEVTEKIPTATRFEETAMRAAPATASAPRAVQHPGAAPIHAPRRLVIPVEIHPYRTGIWGGIAGGIAMAVVACFWGVIREQSLWLPINLLAGVVLPGLEGLPKEQLAALNTGWLLTAIVIHAIGSIFVGLLYTVALPMMPKRPIIFGGLVAPVLWTGLVWASLGIVNPTLERFISWPWFIGSQLAFGLTAGFVISRFNRVPTMQFMPLSERLGVERSADRGGAGGGGGAGALLLLVALSHWLVGCDRGIPLTWKKAAEPAPETDAGFTQLWGANCAGCHGADGSLGPARPLRDPVYLASIGDATLRTIIEKGGGADTMMPAFGESYGASLSTEEIDAIVSGMRRAWARAGTAPSRVSMAAHAPAIAASGAKSSIGTANAAGIERGKAAFARFCAACHDDSTAPRSGARPTGAVPAGSVTDPFFLRLTSVRALRSAIIFGRTDLGMPGVDGPFPELDASVRMSSQEVDDIVRWLAERRTSDWPPRPARQGGAP